MIKRIIERIRRRNENAVQYARRIGVKIGDNCFIDSCHWSSEPYLITVGNNVQITHCVSIHTHGGGQIVRSKFPDFDIFGKVTIEDWAYIGAYAQIMPGVTIGEGALVAAGSVVTKSVAPHTVVGGNPAKFICTAEDYYERNKPFNTKTKGLDYHRKKEVLLSLPDDMFVKK